jgi:hypothetical protein
MQSTTTTITITTGPSVTADTCPSWCTAADRRVPHHCAGPETRVTLGTASVLAARIFDTEDGPRLAVFSDDTMGADLDLAGVDALIDRTAAFVGQLVRMRAQLATEAGR